MHTYVCVCVFLNNRLKIKLYALKSYVRKPRTYVDSKTYIHFNTTDKSIIPRTNLNSQVPEHLMIVSLNDALYSQ